MHLKDSDVLDVTRIESGINIWQGSYVMGDYAFLPDGYAPRQPRHSKLWRFSLR
ncbi:MAG: hypothetical protein J6X91_04460 [Bacteroidales bacterium]|nr:hypothetical protein [Bacteroidales bacterium]MBP5517892.1 hypothetical protein [Bacteroidales bacterium]